MLWKRNPQVGAARAQVPAVVIRTRRRTLQLVAALGPVAGLGTAVVALATANPRLHAWTVLAAWVGLVAAVQLRRGSHDLRVVALAHAMATVFLARMAPPESVPILIIPVALALTVVVGVMGRSRSTVRVLVVMYGMYSAAILGASTEPQTIIGVVTLLVGGAFAWLMLTGIVAQIGRGEGSYRQLFDRVPVGLYRTSISGEVLDANEAFCEIFGMTREQVIGTNARDLLIDDDDLDRLRAELVGKPSLTKDLLFRRADGRMVWLRDRTIAITAEDGTVIGYEGDLQDVTEAKQHVEELETLVRSKSELIGAVSHELRTPLTAVVGCLDLLCDTMDSAEGEQRELLSMAVEQAHEVSAIVEDLLTAARIDNRELLIHPETLNLGDTVEAAVRSLGITETLPVNVEVVDDLSAFADAGRVRQIVRNLVSNAIKYGSPPIRVEIRASRAGAVTVTVIDEGDAIPRDIAKRMFDTFFTGANPSSQPGSIGLGLSVSRRLSQLMGGDLAHSRVGNERRFELSLPRSEAAVQVA